MGRLGKKLPSPFPTHTTPNFPNKRIPLPSLTALSLFGHLLTFKEKEEILAYENIYYIGQNA